MDLATLAKALGQDLLEVLRPALEGAEDDLKRYAAEMAEDALRIAQGQAAEDITSHLKAQALLLSERWRIRFKSGVLDWATKSIGILANLALAAGEAYIKSKIGG